MTLKLYFDLLSQPCRATYIFMKMNSIKFTPVIINLGKGEHFSDEYAEVNPFKKVPAIDDDGFKLSESVAILAYLAEKYNVSDHWYPKDLAKRSRVNEYMGWQQHNLRASASMTFQHRAMIPMMTGKPINEYSLKKYIGQLERDLYSLENVYLKDQPYVAGKGISIADLLCICELMQPQLAGYYVDESKHPILTKYISKVINELQPHFDSAHKMLYKMVERGKGAFGMSKL